MFGYFLKKAIMRILREEATVHRNMMHFLRIFVVRNVVVRNVKCEKCCCAVSERAGYCVCPEEEEEK